MKAREHGKPKTPPAFLTNIALSIVDFLKKLQRKLIPPQTVLLNYAIGNIVINRSIYVAVELGIADQLKDGPKSIAQLAGETGGDADTLYRIMRTLTSEGIFKAKKNKHFETNNLGRHLQTDLEDSMYTFIKATGSDWANGFWDNILETARTGKDFYEKKYGMNFFDWLRNNSQAQRLFYEAMHGISATSDVPVVNAYDFSGFRTIADVGCGSGSQLLAILRAYPEIDGILFDLPSRVEALESEAGSRENKLNERLRYIPGDFFEFVPDGYDAYLMKSVLHDFDDEKAVEVLSNLSRAVPDDAILLIIENILKEDNNEPDFSKVLDVNFMTMMGGRVRTKNEYSHLLEKSGFRLQRVIPTGTPFSILEARPVLARGINFSTSRPAFVRDAGYAPG
ncbi:MAG: hypothetical protein KAW12_15620 [Candidatus Aminicenantes bacterium]|nr:hypothetical protein [Candidatus Aminicenantes bacterium]